MFIGEEHILTKIDAGDFEKEIIEKALEASGIDPKRRGETLTILEFASLSNQIYCLRRETPNK